MTDIPRNERNNNPGNLKFGSPWYGMDVDQPDRTFIRFRSMAWGWRAMFKVLASYKRHGIRTVSGVIKRWAPESDLNPVVEYTKFVERAVSGLYQEGRIDLTDPQIAIPVAVAIARFEGMREGSFSPGDIRHGWRLSVTVTDDVSYEGEVLANKSIDYAIDKILNW